MNKLLKSIFSPGSTSEQWHLNVRDFLKGLATAVFTAPATIILQSVESGHLVTDWPTIWKVALAGGIAYLIKNLLTPAPKL